MLRLWFHGIHILILMLQIYDGIVNENACNKRNELEWTGL